jgi:hypothetical protein
MAWKSKELLKQLTQGGVVKIGSKPTSQMGRTRRFGRLPVTPGVPQSTDIVSPLRHVSKAAITRLEKGHGLLVVKWLARCEMACTL